MVRFTKQLNLINEPKWSDLHTKQLNLINESEWSDLLNN